MKRFRSQMTAAVLALVACSSVLLLHPPGDAITLTAPKLVQAGSSIDLPITLRASSKDLSALQWQVSLPNGVSFDASSALGGKQLLCYRNNCILYGGRTPIPTGIIANLRVTLPKDSHTDVPIALHSVLASTIDGTPRKLRETSLTLKPTP